MPGSVDKPHPEADAAEQDKAQAEGRDRQPPICPQGLTRGWTGESPVARLTGWIAQHKGRCTKPLRVNSVT
jgi:hypothetical protein